MDLKSYILLCIIYQMVQCSFQLFEIMTLLVLLQHKTHTYVLYQFGKRVYNLY